MRTLIRTTLQAFQHWTADVEELVLGTIAHESHLGEDREQIGGQLPAENLGHPLGQRRADGRTEQHALILDQRKGRLRAGQGE